jgi:hypothetical membrane protein
MSRETTMFAKVRLFNAMAAFDQAMALSNASKAGAAVFVGAVQFGVLMIVSEILYSAYGTGGYSVSANYVSDLGATCPIGAGGGACYIPPSAMLFDASVALLGLTFIACAYFMQRAFRWTPSTVSLALTGIGALGVGIFPETAEPFHGIFSLMTFLFAGLSAVLTARFQRKPTSYFSRILGLVTLLALVAVVGGMNLGLGNGGIERIVIYPVLFWAVGFGAYMMASEETLHV